MHGTPKHISGLINMKDTTNNCMGLYVLEYCTVGIIRFILNNKFLLSRACNGGRGVLHRKILDIGFTLIEPYVFINNYNESREENTTYREGLKPVSGSTYALMKVFEKKFGFHTHYAYHVNYLPNYREKNKNTGPVLMEEVLKL